MTSHQEAERLLAAMTHDEKTRLLRTLARDSGGTSPRIEQTRNVVGGSARIVRTRIPVWVPDRIKQLGLSEAEILRVTML